MGAAPLQGPPLLRVHWPHYLSLPSDRTFGVLLHGWHRDGDPQELVVTAAVPAAAAAGGGKHSTAEPVVGTLLQHPSEQPLSTASSPAFVLQPTRVPGGELPLLVAPPAPSGARTRQAARLQQQQQQPWECQVILYDRRSLPQFASSSSGTSQAGGDRQDVQPAARRRQLAALLASRLLGALLACLLLAHGQGLASAAASCGSHLADYTASQLLWLMTAQPAGAKLHRQLCELLGVSGLQYVSAVRGLLAGWGRAIAGTTTGLLAMALVGWGPRRGLVALQCLLWLLALPVSLPYTVIAATYRWQLSSTAVMWRVMRGKQRLPLLRERAAGWVRHWRSGGGSSSSGGQQAQQTALASPHGVAPRSRKFGFSSGGGSGMKQLSGSMLLFMPLLLLLPTTACFYALALVLHAACSLPRAAAQLASQLLRHNPVAAAARALLQAPGSSSGGVVLQYRVLQVQFAGRHLASSEALQAAVRRTTFLLALQGRGSPWRAALQAAGDAWLACEFVPPGQAALAFVFGRPLWLACPDWRCDGGSV